MAIMQALPAANRTLGYIQDGSNNYARDVQYYSNQASSYVYVTGNNPLQCGWILTGNSSIYSNTQVIYPPYPRNYTLWWEVYITQNAGQTPHSTSGLNTWTRLRNSAWVGYTVINASASGSFNFTFRRIGSTTPTYVSNPVICQAESYSGLPP